VHEDGKLWTVSCQSIERPDICIGTDSFHTPNELITLIKSFCNANGLSAAINKPFAGTYVPLMYLENDKRVSSIMIEVNRSLYMDERTGDRSSQFSRTKNRIDNLINEVIDFEAMRKGE
jgi:N-formylglutamate deformylase